ncbi:glycerol-3-phosphate dehydrogenase/oxidase [Flavobacterium sp. LB3P122]|uniref:glycerol-3-phosphate dehydrogenase/oxidase n=1 Tax=Flavobacterium algoriphilum TaxID=3398738 RepID=UPI003A89A72C
MNRDTSIDFLNQNNITWDIIIIGGGATGLGIALDAVLRGYKTLLMEQSDFTKGTSSRSTKLVHGGVRYLAQGNIRLVLEALHERGLLFKNAPHLTQNQSFIIPSFSIFGGYFFTLGLKIYDLMAGRLSLGNSAFINAQQVQEYLPGIKSKHLKNGTLYHDGQFDDARLGINLAQTSVENGAHLLNYMQVTGLGKDENGKINQVQAIDLETGKLYSLKTKTVINATGVFADAILRMDDVEKKTMILASQGTHLVLDQSFLPTDYALMIPKTSDGRVLFAIPWYNKVVVGTTDTVVDLESLEPRALKKEVDFILSTLNQYLVKTVTRADVLSVFSGLRPLARPQKKHQKTKEISRGHKIIVSKSGLISIIGGKWTTYRRMAEDTLDRVIKKGNLRPSKCITKEFKIHGYTQNQDLKDPLHQYGSDAEGIRELALENPKWAEKLHPAYPFIKAEVIWAVRHEMARNVEDVLARRLRILFLDARTALLMAPETAQLIATEREKPDSWIQEQIKDFEVLAKGYWLE